jgi:hypothetical protein
MNTKYMGIALEIVKELEADNGCKFDFFPERLVEIAEGVARMEADGVEFTVFVIAIVGCGGEDDIGHGLYSKDGYDIINQALELIFDSPLVGGGPDSSHHKPGL